MASHAPADATQASRKDGTLGRNRLHYAVFTMITIVFGLLSRTKAADILPELISNHAGDVLWAAMVYLLFGTLFPQMKLHQVVLTASLFAAGIEVSQLFRPAWLEAVRNLPGARLVFGYGFLWSDLVCYAVGITIAAVIDRGMILKYQRIVR